MYFHMICWILWGLRGHLVTPLSFKFICPFILTEIINHHLKPLISFHDHSRKCIIVLLFGWQFDLDIITCQVDLGRSSVREGRLATFGKPVYLVVFLNSRSGSVSIWNLGQICMETIVPYLVWNSAWHIFVRILYCICENKVITWHYCKYMICLQSLRVCWLKSEWPVPWLILIFCNFARQHCYQIWNSIDVQRKKAG